VAPSVLVDGHQARNAVPLHELAPNEVARALRRHHADVDLGARLDLAEVDREAVGEHEQVPRRDPVLDLALPDLGLLLVGQQHHDDVALAGRVRDGRDAQPVALGLLHRGGVLAEPHHHVDA
jgi:hypothetical protein